MSEIARDGLVNNPLLWNTHFCIPNFFIERDIQAWNEVSNTEHKIYPYFYTVTKLKLLNFSACLSLHMRKPKSKKLIDSCWKLIIRIAAWRRNGARWWWWWRFLWWFWHRQSRLVWYNCLDVVAANAFTENRANTFVDNAFAILAAGVTPCLLAGALLEDWLTK